MRMSGPFPEVPVQFYRRGESRASLGARFGADPFNDDVSHLRSFGMTIRVTASPNSIQLPSTPFQSSSQDTTRNPQLGRGYDSLSFFTLGRLPIY